MFADDANRRSSNGASRLASKHRCLTPKGMKDVVGLIDGAGVGTHVTGAGNKPLLGSLRF